MAGQVKIAEGFVKLIKKLFKYLNPRGFFCLTTDLDKLEKTHQTVLK